jgi:glucose-1-phosphate adenylyltransferase
VRLPADMRPEIIAIVLGGGRGTRLYPLTRHRSKPAVPLAGKYRLIDVPISNCINSGIHKIYVLTQFNSASLNRHVAQTYKFDAFTQGFVEILAAEQTLETEMWFQGTADAVRRNLRHVLGVAGTHILVLSGDALWRQDFRELFKQHIADEAEITVCCKLVDESEAPSFGIVGINEARHIVSFHEKPARERLAALRVSPHVLERAGLRTTDKPLLASMGIYLFQREVLEEVLRDASAEDFGKQVIPRAIGSHRIVAHLFDGYWEDIGTIKTFFTANLDLLKDNPSFDFYDPASPIFTRSRFLPSSEIVDSEISRAMLAEGCLIRRAQIRNSIVGIRSIIGEGARVENSIVMGADYYEREHLLRGLPPRDPPLGIGAGSIIRNAIIDKNARIGERCQIVNRDGTADADTDTYSIRDGIVIIPKDTAIAPGTVI